MGCGEVIKYGDKAISQFDRRVGIYAHHARIPAGMDGFCLKTCLIVSYLKSFNFSL
jgi:hypothetical protein